MDEVHVVTFSPDGKRLASGGRDGSIQIWEAAPQRPPQPFNVLPQTVGDFQFTPDGKSYAYCAFPQTNGLVNLYDTTSGALRERFIFTNAWGLTFSPDGDLIVVSPDQLATDGDREGIILQVRGHKTDKVVTNIAAEGRGLLRLSTTGKTLATVFMRSNRWFSGLWDTSSWRERTSIALPPQANPEAVCLTDTTLICGSRRDGFVEVLEIPSGKLLVSFKAHNEPCSGLALSPDASLLATGSENGEAKLWNTTAWEEKSVFRGDLLGVESVGFSPDGRRLAIGSHQKEAVKLWDLATGQELATLEGQGEFFRRVMFSADGRAIAAVTHGGVVNIWRAPTWSEIDAAEPTNSANGTTK